MSVFPFWCSCPGGVDIKDRFYNLFLRCKALSNDLDKVIEELVTHKVRNCSELVPCWLD